MFIYLFHGQCTCQYIVVTVSILEWDSLRHSSRCSIFLSSSCNWKRYMCVVTCVQCTSGSITWFTLHTKFRKNIHSQKIHVIVFFNSMNVHCIKLIHISRSVLLYQIEDFLHNTNRCNIFSKLLILFLCFAPGLGSEDEVRLVEHLFDRQGYNPLIRPVRNLTEKVAVKFGLAMIQLINVVCIP